MASWVACKNIFQLLSRISDQNQNVQIQCANVGSLLLHGAFQHEKAVVSGIKINQAVGPRGPAPLIIPAYNKPGVLPFLGEDSVCQVGIVQGTCEVSDTW